MALHPAALLFDMDGVLVDSQDSWWRALNDALAAYRLPKLSRQDFIRRFWGFDLKVNLSRLGLPPEVAGFCNKVYEEYLGCTVLYPETRPTLEALARYRKAVITNSPCACVTKILDRFVLTPYFEAIVTSDDVAKGKPDPELVHVACRTLSVRPQDVVLIGDTANDVAAGHAAGCIVIGLNVKADVTIHSLSELLPLL